MNPVEQTPPLVFSGTADQLEDAADYALILDSLEDRRVNLICSAVETPVFLLGALANLALGRPAAAASFAALAVLLGIVSWRRVTGRAAIGGIRSNRRVRRRGQEKGKYDGSARFRLELDGAELRLYEQDGTLKESFDCRLFHNAAECEEVIWITGWTKMSVTLPKKLLTRGTEEELRACLRPHIKKWKTVEIPPAWREKLSNLKQENVR